MLDCVLSEGSSMVTPSNSIFFIKSGEVEVMMDGHVISRLYSGDYLGETALLFGEGCSVTVMARTRTRMKEMTICDLEELSESSPCIMMLLTVAQSLIQQRRDLTNQFAQAQTDLAEVKRQLKEVVAQRDIYHRQAWVKERTLHLVTSLLPCPG